MSGPGYDGHHWHQGPYPGPPGPPGHYDQRHEGTGPPYGPQPQYHQPPPPPPRRDRRDVGPSEGFAALVALAAVGGATYFIVSEEQGRGSPAPPPESTATPGAPDTFPFTPILREPKRKPASQSFGTPMFIGLLVFVGLCGIGYIVAYRRAAAKSRAVSDGATRWSPFGEVKALAEKCREHLGTARRCWQGLSWGLTLAALLVCGTFLQDQGMFSLAAGLYGAVMVSYTGYLFWRYYRRGRHGTWEKPDTFWFFVPVVLVLLSAEVVGSLGYEPTRRTLHLMALVFLGLWLSVITALPYGDWAKQLRASATLYKDRGAIVYGLSQILGAISMMSENEQAELDEMFVNEGIWASLALSYNTMTERGMGYLFGVAKDAENDAVKGSNLL